MSSSHRYSGAHQHTRNKTSLGSITYADLANTFSRPGNPPVPGLPAIGHNPYPPRPIQHPPQQQHQAPRPPAETHRENVLRVVNTPTDREIPDGVENMVVGDVVERYNALRNLERRLDAVMINKRLGGKDGGIKFEKKTRVMRVWVSAEPKKKPGQEDTRMTESFEFNDQGGPVEYKVKIQGRLLDDVDDDSDSDDEDKPTETMDLDKSDAPKPTSDSTGEHKLSHYFKQITITFHPSSSTASAPPPPQLEWTQSERASNGTLTSPESVFDALEFTPKFDGPFQKCTITMHRAEGHNRTRGKLSEPLARLLDREYEDQSGAMMGVYNYVRLKGLEEEGQPQKFRCDEQLRPIFKRDVADFIYAPEVIAENILPPPPVVIPFTIRSNPDGTAPPPTIFDIPVIVEGPMDLFAAMVYGSSDRRNPEFLEKLKKIQQLDKDTALSVQAMQMSKARVNFLRQMSDEPVGFLKKWISSQKADEEVFLGEEKGRGPEWSHGGLDSVWNSQGARDAVGVLLARPKTTQ